MSSFNFSSWICCMLGGLGYRKSWTVRGIPRLIRQPLFVRIRQPKRCGKIIIGESFKCNNSLCSNSIGLIQPCIFNVFVPGSVIEIGNNVGISGSTLNACTTIKIGDNTIIGSGCLITDTDSHPISASVRISGIGDVKESPIFIGSNVFIGARCIILKGVTIGNGSVVGAGSVVAKDVPENVVVAGNPARIIKKLSE